MLLSLSIASTRSCRLGQPHQGLTRAMIWNVSSSSCLTRHSLHLILSTAYGTSEICFSLRSASMESREGAMKRYTNASSRPRPDLAHPALWSQDHHKSDSPAGSYTVLGKSFGTVPLSTCLALGASSSLSLLGPWITVRPLKVLFVPYYAKFTFMLIVLLFLSSPSILQQCFHS